MNTLLKYLFIFTAFLFCSCIAPAEYSPINTYDLGHIEQTATKLNIGSIDQNGPYNSKMIYRVSPQKLELKEYDRWSQSPDLILTNFFKKAFQPRNDLSLEGEIISFENNLITGHAILSFQFKITKAGRIIQEGIFNEKVPCGESSEEFAAAMSKLANNLVQVIIEKSKE